MDLGLEVVVFQGALLAASFISSVFSNIKDWWNNKISGKRCMKNIIDQSVAGFARFVGADFLERMCDRLTQRIFGIPRTQALENAYKHLGVDWRASELDINRAYRRLCLRHHPDRGGDVEEYVLLQSHMQVIRQEREM